MSEKEATEEAINKKLEEIMEDVAMTKVEQLFTKLLFNVRFDLNEMKLELLKFFKDECEEVNPISRKWFKIGTKTFYIYNIFWFLYSIISWNIIMILKPDWYIVIFITSLIIFSYTIVDLLWDCLCLWRVRS